MAAQQLTLEASLLCIPEARDGNECRMALRALEGLGNSTRNRASHSRTSLKTLSRVVQSDVYRTYKTCNVAARGRIVASAGTIYGLARPATEIGDKTRKPYSCRVDDLLV